MPETTFASKKGTLKDQLSGVKMFFRTLQKERDFKRAEEQRNAQIRKQRVGKPKVKQ